MNNNDENEKNSDRNNFSFGQFFNKPSSDIFQALSGKVIEILQKEINLLKAGFKEDLKASKITIGLFGVGIISGFMTLVLLFVTLIFALARVIPGWIAGLIISSFTGLIATFTITTGLRTRAKDLFANLKGALNSRNALSSEDKEIRRAA